MKFWIKIVVALSVIVVLGFGVWAFFFKEKNEVVAYNKTSELVDYKESLGLKQKLNDLQSYDYIGDDVSNVIDDSTSTKKDILNIREIMLSPTIIITYDEGGNVTCYFDSYIIIEDYLDNAILYVLPYLKNIKTDNNLLKNLKNNVNEYIDDLKEFDTAIDILNECQKNIEGTEIEFEVLLGNYNSLRIKYKQLLNDGANLLNSILDCIRNNYGFLKFDTNFALIDSFARSLQVSSNVDEKREPFFSHDLHLVIDKLNKLNNNSLIFNEEFDEYSFLTSYNNLINKFEGEYDKALSKHNLEKKQMADNQNLSDIKQDAQKYLVVVLNILGY